MADVRNSTNKKQRVVMLAALFVMLAFALFFFSKVSAGAADDNNELCHVYFKASGITTDDVSKVLIDGNRATIGKSGRFIISGTGVGQIVVDTLDTQDMEITMQNLNLTCEYDAPFLVRTSGDVVLIADGDNFLSDSSADTDDEVRVKACLYSKSDLKLIGDGSLTVDGHYHHGISVRGDMYTELEMLNVTAPANAIDVNDSIILAGGHVNLLAKGDGINAVNADDAKKGSVSIVGGTISIDAGDEGIQADTEISVKGGRTSIKSSGDLFKCDGSMDIDNDLVTAVLE